MTDAPIDLPATIAKLRELAAKATPGPRTLGPGPHYPITFEDGTPLLASWFAWDAAFIAACDPQTVAALCDAAARVAALEAENARLRIRRRQGDALNEADFAAIGEPCQAGPTTGELRDWGLDPETAD